MACHNHELFVEQAVQSVLDQTFEDLELIIVDDGSIDRSVEKIRRFQDPRIRLTTQTNRGPSAAFNTCLERARGEFVAVIASDDVCRKDRVEKQLAHLRQTNLDAVFALPEIIDETGRTLSDHHFAEFFKPRWQSTTELRRRLFHESNFLCASTAFIRKSVLDRVGGFRLGSLQLQDFDLWIRLAWHASMGRMEDRLVQYRVRSDGANLSGKKNNVRTQFEYQMVMRAFFEEASPSLMRESFPGLVSPDVASSSRERELEISFIFLSHHDAGVRGIGAERIYRQVEDAQSAALLEERWNMGPPELYALTNTLDLRNDTELEKLKESNRRLMREVLVARGAASCS